MNSPTYKSLESRIDSCMIADRFGLWRDLKKKKERLRVTRAIEKSEEHVARRKATRPVVSYPENLPISKSVGTILQKLLTNQVVIIAGETGSGKTTQLPKICLDAGLGLFGTIGHTQPRRVAARTIAYRLAEELKVNLGNEVGYQMRFQDVTRPITLIKVMTDGVLLAETQNDRFLERYDTLIIDEAHERSLNIDFLLGYIKRILPKRPDLKVVITSATIDVERFSRHFNGAPVVEVSGRTYPVEVHYRPINEELEEDEPDTRVILDVLDEIEGLPNGDVLVFLPGEREIRDTAKAIKRKGPKGYEVLPLYSRLGVAEQNRIFADHRGRRIVLATNVAETSLTVPGIRYVIDPGVARLSRYSLRSKVQQLPIEAISQASANQRMGRCGRTAAGVCFRLYAEDDYESRPKYTTPEIMRTNLAAVILKMLNLKLGDIQKFPFVQRPDQKQINDGYALLFELGAVDRHRRITRLGKRLSRFPVDLRFARMLLAAGDIGCLSEVLIVVSGLSVQDPRERPYEYQKASDEKHRRYWNEKSDFLTMINLWHSYEEQRQLLSQSQLRTYCRDNFLSFARMREWREIRRQLLLVCKEIGLKVNIRPADYAPTHRAILTGLLGHVSQRSGENKYTGARNRLQFIFPGSSQFLRKPKWIMSAELIETTRLYARTVAEVDSRWIETLAGHLVQRSYHEPEFDHSKGHVVAREEVTLFGLVIINNRRIDFGNVDSQGAREIFLQKGLVEGKLKTRLKFFAHNRRIIRDIETMESKSRKRDILVESRVLYDFYDEVIPRKICSELELAAFVNQSTNNAKRLQLTRTELMRREAELSEALYPDSLKIGSTQLPLRYKFEPGETEDGINIDIPLILLGQIPKAQLDWLVPGLLREKCLALIRSLPKSLRKRFVPAPEYVDKVLESFEYDGKPLTVALADRLFRTSGTRVSADDFQPEVLDRHLSINIRVVDERGTVVAAGRNLTSLVESLGEKINRELQKRSEHILEMSGATDWLFEDLPEAVEILQGGVKVILYPAIVDEGETVGIKLVETKSLANRRSELGILRLLMLRLRDQVRYLEKNIPDFDKFALYFATRGSGTALKNGIVRSTFRMTFLEGADIRSRAAFEEALNKRELLFENMEQIAFISAKSLEHAFGLESAAKALAYTDIADDILGQLERLFPQDFPEGIALNQLHHYPRYLKAISYRLERINPLKDRASMLLVREWQNRYLELDEDNQIRLADFRWMLEEYRVSLFAQSVGTSTRVSDKRLAREWESLMGLRR